MLEVEPFGALPGLGSPVLLKKRDIEAPGGSRISKASWGERPRLFPREHLFPTWGRVSQFLLSRLLSKCVCLKGSTAFGPWAGAHRLSRGLLGAWKSANPSLASSASNTRHLSCGPSPDSSFLLPPSLLLEAGPPVKEHSHPPPPSASLNLALP